MIDQKIRKRMAAELEKFGMPSGEALERVNNIAQVIILEEEIDRNDIEQMISPYPDFRSGIANEELRREAAARCLGAYFILSIGSELSKWTALQMWCGMTEVEASAFMHEFSPAKAGE